MEPEPEGTLDAQVQQALAELQQAGESASVETVARRVRRRTADVMEAIRRLTQGTPALDVDTDPAAYSEVLAADAVVVRISEQLARAEASVREAEAELHQAEVLASQDILEGQEPRPLTREREALRARADRLSVLTLAHQEAKQRHATALTQAQAQRWQRQWTGYQAAVKAFDEALRAAYEAQEQARQVWNDIGQPGEVPLLTTGLMNWQPYFHQFLQSILDTEPSQVNRGVMFRPY